MYLCLKLIRGQKMDKNGYILEITFNLENYGTKEKYTEDGRLKYYINVEPVR